MKDRGYVAKTEIDPESGLIFGEVVGLRDTITFQGMSVSEAVQAFRDSLDLYLKTCAEQGLEPERTYSGSIAVRTKPRVHRALVALAKARGQSLNDLVDQVLTRTVRRAGLATSAAASPAGSTKGPPSEGANAARARNVAGDQSTKAKTTSGKGTKLPPRR